MRFAPSASNARATGRGSLAGASRTPLRRSRRGPARCTPAARPSRRGTSFRAPPPRGPGPRTGCGGVNVARGVSVNVGGMPGERRAARLDGSPLYLYVEVRRGPDEQLAQPRIGDMAIVVEPPSDDAGVPPLPLGER